MTTEAVPTPTPSDTTDRDLETVLDRAAGATRPFAGWSPGQRRSLLAACGQALLDAADQLVPLAMAETNLPEARLRGEIARTAYQFELYGAAVLDDDHVTLTPADPSAQPAPVPDLRLTTRPIGPVLVFSASNFPFAFSIAGTDTASALAAGCPVVVKAHPGHPRTSAATAAVIRRVLEQHDAPAGIFDVIYGLEVGVKALQDPRVSAAAFTGSLKGGRYLFDIASRRDTPIPFFGELGSLNPVLVGPHAAAHRGDQITAGFFASFTLGAGQFCTKPGVLFWPAEVALPSSLLSSVESAQLHPLLNSHIEQTHAHALEGLRQAEGVSVIAGQHPDAASDGVTRPVLLETTAAHVGADPDAILVECFGPSALVVTYRDGLEIEAALRGIDGFLTGSVHADEQDDEWTAPLLPVLEERAGRVVWGEWPTGVAVAAAQHHGGPYPATTSSLYTSVGTHAIERFRRPIAYQSFPERFLPNELRSS